MITFTEGNLFDSDAEALVNTVNTVGVMGKGIALMFRERFAENYALYRAACKAEEVTTGKMFVTDTQALVGPRWIINFPTKRHWRAPSRLEWITEGLEDLRRVLIERNVRSVAIPPLGAGNGGLAWADVREQVVSSLSDLDVDIVVFEPTVRYLNTRKQKGVERLTPPRALAAELIRRYWVLGMECSLLEVQKLMWLMERAIGRHGPASGELNLNFRPRHYGPYAQRLQYVIDDLDGSYLRCDRRIGDARPHDVIWFNEERAGDLNSYWSGEGRGYLPALEHVTELIDGFESPFGMELLATVAWLVDVEGIEPRVHALQSGLKSWPAGNVAAERKSRLFDEHAIEVALGRLSGQPLSASWVC